MGDLPLLELGATEDLYSALSTSFFCSGPWGMPSLLPLTQAGSPPDSQIYRLGPEPKAFSSLVRAHIVQGLVGGRLLLAGVKASETQSELGYL